MPYRFLTRIALLMLVSAASVSGRRPAGWNMGVERQKIRLQAGSGAKKPDAGLPGGQRWHHRHGRHGQFGRQNHDSGISGELRRSTAPRYRFGGYGFNQDGRRVTRRNALNRQSCTLVSYRQYGSHGFRRWGIPHHYVQQHSGEWRSDSQRPSVRSALATLKQSVGHIPVSYVGIASPCIMELSLPLHLMSDEFVQRILKVIIKAQKVPADTVTLDSRFDELNIDSMDAVEILFELETEFDVIVPDDQMRSMHTVREVAESVEKLMTEKVSGTTAP